MTQYEDCIIFLLAKAYQKAHGHFKKRLQGSGLTPVQHLVLEALWAEEGLSARDIGKKLMLDSATLSGILERMAEKGWIVKSTDEVDKRFIRIYLADRAKDMKTLLIEEREQANEKILVALSLEEKVLLKRLLRDLRE
ncbi:MAG: MarR family transcriptional regulator [Deltaproteobacteria bacterium]|jgi:DNA-binding MarR family transcriptional regulator|nr:MarR family transcriptional regulator [Deltaproteobacteria bacterium]